MTKNTLTQQIQPIINDTLNRQPYPQIVTITHIYPDGHADIKNPEYGELKHIPTITPHQVGDTTVLIFCNNKYTERIII